MKPLLNTSEALADERLRRVVETHGARVFVKPRLADVLPIERSGIGSDDYSYALRAHFDFVIADGQHKPLFAVEFDGPLHADAKNAAKDARKNNLCLRFDLPLLRVNSNYLKSTYRGLDLLTWAVEVWFTTRWLNEAQAEGYLPEDEPIMPSMAVTLPGHDQPFPLWLSIEPLRYIRSAHDQDKSIDLLPSTITAMDARGNYRAFSFLRVSSTRGLVAESAMRGQRFPIIESELLEDIVVFELAETLRRLLSGEAVGVPLCTIYDRLGEFRAKYEMRSFTSFGGARSESGAT